MSEDPNAALAKSLNIISRPTLRQRFINWLGYGWPGFPNTDVVDKDPAYTAGAMIHNIQLFPSFRDRLLFLFGGSIAIRSLVKTDARVGRSTVLLEWSVMPPGEEFR